MHFPLRSATKRTSAAIALIGVALVMLRGFQLSWRTLYWDDFLIPARYWPLTLTEIFQLHDNHLMPGAILMQTTVARAAPLQWLPPALIIVALTILSFLLWLPVLHYLAPHRPQLQLLGLILLSFSPFLMDAAGWWSAALNAYAWQCSCAGVLWAMLRSGHAWHRSMIAALALLLGLLFTEKALTILPVAAIVVWIFHRLRSEQPTWRLFALPGIVMSAWLILYLPRLTFSTGELPISGIPKAIFQAIIPGAVGGPWQWQRWQPSKAFADPNLVVCGLAFIVAATFLYLFAYRRPQRLYLAAPVLAYLAAVWLLLFNARAGEATTDLLLRSLHYYADWWAFVVLVGLASAQQIDHHSPKPVMAFSWLFIISAVVSTYTWTHAWQADTAREYVSNLRIALDTSSVPILDQQTPLEILSPLTHPDNRVSSIAGIPPVNITTQPQVFDAHGKLHPAEVAPIAYSKLGPEARCGYRIAAGESVEIPIDPLLQFGDWVWELNALASAENMTLTITTPNLLETAAETNSRAITVAAPTSLNRHWVRVPGGGDRLKIKVTGSDPISTVCIGAGAIGPLVPTK